MQDGPRLYAVQPTGAAFVHDDATDVDVVHVFGDVDLATSPEFEDTLKRASQTGRPLVVDLTECRFIDSSAIAVLVRAYKRLGKLFCLVVPSTGNIARVLSICKLDTVFSIVPSLEAAVTVAA